MAKNTSAFRSISLISTLAAGLLLCCASCASAENPAKPSNSQQFAAGWEQASRPLFKHGPERDAGTTQWWVSPTFPRANYVLINRNGDGVELIKDYKFSVSGAAETEILLMLPSEYNDVEALDEKFVLKGPTAGTAP